MTTLALLFASTSLALSLPPGLLSAVCYVESKHRVGAIHHDDGNGDSLGVCQIKLNTARLLGFKGTQDELMDPKTNIKYAGLYLQRQLNRYEANSPKAVSAYNAGKFKQGKDRFAINQAYVDRVFGAWAEER